MEPADDDDLHLALLVIQQLSLRRLPGVDPAWEEEPSLVRLRHRLERRFEEELRVAAKVPQIRDAREVPDALGALLAAADGPSLSEWVAEHATLDHLREFVVHRAAYQLQEADPHTFALPRLASGVSKTALLEIQADEYGGHVPGEAHAALYHDTMEILGLEPVADLDPLPAATLRTNTFLNSLGRSRRLTAACIGHLAVFEMTSVEPMARYAAAVRRLVHGAEGTAAARFYDVHVAADGHHARLALEGLVGGFVEQYPEEAEGVLFGAAGLVLVEHDFTDHLIRAWQSGETSLRTPLPGSALRHRGTRVALAG